MKTITYKGYQASVEFEDGVLFVKVLHIDDLLIAQCDRASEAEDALRELVDAYIDDCNETGREPTKPFKGSFQVRLTPELHRRAAKAAAEEKLTLNGWMVDAVSEKIDSANSRSKDIQFDPIALRYLMGARMDWDQDETELVTRVTHTQWRDDTNIHRLPIPASAAHRRKLHG